jgi:hypothetical protein
VQSLLEKLILDQKITVSDKSICTPHNSITTIAKQRHVSGRRQRNSVVGMDNSQNGTEIK